MTDASSTTDCIEDYHIRVYYDEATKPKAKALRARLEAAFPDAVYGRWHDKPVGPPRKGPTKFAFRRRCSRKSCRSRRWSGTADGTGPPEHRRRTAQPSLSIWLGASPALNSETFERKAG